MFGVGSEWGSGGLAAGGEPLAAKLAALLLGGAAPDTGVLVGGEGEVEAGLADLAIAWINPKVRLAS